MLVSFKEFFNLIEWFLNCERVRDYVEENKIRLESRAEDLETIIAIQRASFKAVYENIRMNMIAIWRAVNESNGSGERPNSYYYFVKR